MKGLIAGVLIFGSSFGICPASEETPAPLESIDVQSLKKAEFAGRIQIDSTGGPIRSVKITAHGREINLPRVEFEKLKNVFYSQVSITHEGGLERLGGPVIYFTLRHRGMFGGDPFDGDPILEEKVTIAVPKSRPPTVTKTRNPVVGLVPP